MTSEAIMQKRMNPPGWKLAGSQVKFGQEPHD